MKIMNAALLPRWRLSCRILDRPTAMRDRASLRSHYVGIWSVVLSRRLSYLSRWLLRKVRRTARAAMWEIFRNLTLTAIGRHSYYGRNRRRRLDVALQSTAHRPVYQTACPNVS